MLRRAICVLPVLFVAGCAVTPARQPVPTAPRRAGPVSVAERVRREGWITRFWAQLTPAQRRRVLARLRQGDPPLAETEAAAAPIWDSLGLPERDALVFGAGAAALRQHPARDMP